GTKRPLDTANVDRLANELEQTGVIALPQLLSPEQLRGMQHAFAAKLKRRRWNQFDGYQRTEPYRLMVEDVLLLGQGCLDFAVHPLVKEIDRKSTRLNSSHLVISYAVFCLKKKSI